ncbi:prephenate dehydrogenase/arogenate dehydrogenase family protein [Candidatus Peribacteria bacterium]|nr:prephenate dehydrogenase/arogenate dehydrogenase family protein [Candidatus Peribacteria bacterium]
MESLSNIIGKRTVGVVGVGKWGKHLVQTVSLHSLHPMLQSDPVRAKTEPNFPHVPLDELTERADIIFLSAPLDAIPGIILEMRAKLRPNQIVIDIGSSKEGFINLVQEIDSNDGTALFGSIHPMTGVPPDPPSLRGQNGIICPVSERSKEADMIGEAFFRSQEMTIHWMQAEVHDRLMRPIQGMPHFLQVAGCVAIGSGLSDGHTVDDLDRLCSPNSELFMLSVGRGMTLDAHLQASLIANMASSKEGKSELEQVIVSMQRILELAQHDKDRPKEERKLPAFIEDARDRLDPQKIWRTRMRAKTNTIIVRLGNIRKKSLHLTARKDHIGLLENICAILAHHGIDLNAIDSLPSKNGMEFELGRKDKALVDISRLASDLDAIDVLLAETDIQQ